MGTLSQEGASLLIPITQDAHALRRSAATDMLGADGHRKLKWSTAWRSTVERGRWCAGSSTR